MKRVCFVIFALVFALMPGRASADYAFEFANGSGGLTSNFNVNAGSTVNVQVYLVQTGSTTALNSPGLSSGGVALTSFNQSLVSVSAISGNTGAGAFDYANTSGTGTAQANLTVGQLTSPAVTSSSGAILLGTFTFTGVSAGTTTFATTLPNPDPPYANNVIATTPTPTDIDSLIAGANGIITVTAVPEPGSLILGGLFAAGIAGGYLRRRRIVVPA